jgi:hypothetical protein
VSLACLFGFIGLLDKPRQDDYMDGAQNHPQYQSLFHSLPGFREIGIICLKSSIFRKPSESAGKGAERQEADVYLRARRREKVIA